MARTFVNLTAEQVSGLLDGEVVVYREAAVEHVASMCDRGGFDIDDFPLSLDDTLWVRETWQHILGVDVSDWESMYPDFEIRDWLKGRAPKTKPDWGETVYRQNIGWHDFNNEDRENRNPWPWRASTQMPRWASRLNVSVVGFNVEKVSGGWDWVVELKQAPSGES